MRGRIPRMAVFVTKITETTYQETAPRVDADQGILYGVKLLGESSKNGRRYTGDAIKNAVALYEDRKIYVNHPRRDELSDDRKFESWAGVSRNPIARHDGIYGDIHLRKKSDYFEGIIEAAERFPNSVGFSHVADGTSRLDGDTEIIESITEVFSVDLVTDPATTAGFFESKQQPHTVKQAIESLPAGTVRKRLLEMIDSGYMDGSQSMENADPMTQMCQQLIAALVEALRTLSMSKEEPTPDPALGDVAAEPETPPTPPPSPETPPPADKTNNADNAGFQAMRKENAELKAKNLLLESGRDATPARIKALAASNEADCQELLESWPIVEGERPVRSPALAESVHSVSPEYIHERFASLLKK